MPKTKFPALSSIASLTSLVSQWVSRPSQQPFLCQPQPQAHGRILDEEEDDDDAVAPPVPRPGIKATGVTSLGWLDGWLCWLVFDDAVLYS